MHTPQGTRTNLIPQSAIIPPAGIICSHPGRVALIQDKFLTEAKSLADYRGFTLVSGKFGSKHVFVANCGIGIASAACMLESLIVRGVKIILRLGTTDNPVHSGNAENLFLVNRATGLVGLMLDYGYKIEESGGVEYPSSSFNSYIHSTAKNVALKLHETNAYHVEGFHALLNPKRFSVHPNATESRCQDFAKKGFTHRDMETTGLFFLGRIREIHTASLLMSVVKYGDSGGKQTDRNELTPFLANSIKLALKSVTEFTP